MGIVAWPDSVQLSDSEECTICGHSKTLAELSAGMCDFKGVQRFACSSHARNERELLIGWTDFLVEQYWQHKVDPQGKTLGEF